MPPKKSKVGALKNAVRVAQHVVITDKSEKRLLQYLQDAVTAARQHRDAMLPRVAKWRRTIRGERAQGRIRTSASNLSVPLTIWARTAVRARLTESLLENRPILTIDPIPGRLDKEEPRSTQTKANAVARFLSSQILSSRALNGRVVVGKLAAEVVDLGASSMKVVPQRDQVRKVGIDRDGKPQLTLITGEVKWEFISLLDLIWVDGYGTDTQAMPLVGHEFPMTWAEIRQNASLGHYRTDIVDQISQAFDDKQSQKPLELQEHNIAELYLDWDVDEDGIMEAIVIDWHILAQKILRINWNPFEAARRPILVSQFDFPDDLTKLQGQGVSEKLEGPQDEADAVHNIAIEAGKRGVAHVIVLKAGTRAEEDFGGGQDLLPGDVLVTETPDEDIKNIPLGASDAALAAIQIEEHTRVYVTRILGLDESKVGNVESGKRVTAAVGMATIKEGRMIIKAALTSLAQMLNEASYMTLELYKRTIPMKAMRATLSPEEINDVQEVIVTSDGEDMRDAFQITFNAQDAAITEESRKQEMMIINQALFPFYDRMGQMIIQLASPELPPAAKKPLLMLMERMERGIEALLNTVQSIPNPEELMVSIGELKEALESDGSTTEPASPDPTDPDSALNDLGAGVV